jgi:hypothetical protein
VSGFPKTGDEVTFQAPAVDADTQITFTLEVSDGINPPVTDSVTLTVTDGGPANSPPANVSAVVSMNPAAEGATVTLSGSAQDPEEDPLTYTWSTDYQMPGFTNLPGFPSTSTQVVLSLPQVNADTPITFTLSVSDGTNPAVTDTVTVNINDIPNGNSPPVNVSAVASPNPVMEGATVTLTGSAQDPDGDNLAYIWSVDHPIPGFPQTGQQVTFTAPVVDANTPITIFLGVYDGVNGGVGETLTITVKSNSPPTAPSSSLTPTNGQGVWESKTGQAILTVNNAEDPEGDILTYGFELYSEPIAASEYLIASDTQINEGHNITAWLTPVLQENTFYYWRARADDGENTGPWMELATIFVNAIEENPGMPAVSSPADGTSVATTTPILEVTNAVDPDMDALTYEFRIYLDPNDPIDLPHLEMTGILEGTSGTSQWVVETPLDDNHTYGWRIRALDDTGLAGDWTAPATFLVNTVNDPPGQPVVRFPLDESEIDTLTPEFEIEAVQDPEGDPVEIYVEVDVVNTFDSAGLIQSQAIEQTSSLTTWPVPQSLIDNTMYYYRVKTSDGEAENAWSNGAFFVNLENEPPTQPVNQLPEDQEIVTTLAPTLIASAATDPDQDTITYEFELFLSGNLTDPVQSITQHQGPSWVASDPNLVNGKKYFWRVRAVDEHDQSSGWSELTQFTIGANAFRPSIPQRVTPFDGGTVNTLTPVLSVVASEDGDDNPVWIEFELYRDRNLSDFVSFGFVARGTTATSWPVDETLEDLTEYFWRVRATDGEKYSPWTTVGSFTVDLSNQTALHIRVWQVANYDPFVPWPTVVSVDDPLSPILGANVILTPGALSANETIFIGEVTGAPSFGTGVIPMGKVLEFGPLETVFNVPVEIKIPYTDEELESAGGITPEELSVYRYDDTNQLWEEIAVTQVDHEQKQLICEVEHFSLYATAVEDNSSIGPEDEDPSGENSSGGGGGCFIGSAGRSPIPVTLIGRAIVALLILSLVALKSGVFENDN